MYLYRLCDEKAGHFDIPRAERNDDTARRAFILALKDDSTLLGQAPGDFSLWLVGVTDDESGEIQPISPRVIVRGSDVARPVLKEASNA